MKAPYPHLLLLVVAIAAGCCLAIALVAPSGIGVSAQSCITPQTSQNGALAAWPQNA